MALYTERNGLRVPVEKTYQITPDRYHLLLDVCKRHFDNISWKYQERCPDGKGSCGIDLKHFRMVAKYRMPTLEFDERNNIITPINFNTDACFSIFDLIEFICLNWKDISKREFHSFYKHYDITFSESNEQIGRFKEEINDAFEKMGLLYTLTEKYNIERIVWNSSLIEEAQNSMEKIQEKGMQELLNEAIIAYKTPNPSARQTSVEKIWDAFERLKTYYTFLSKKDSAEKIVNDMANNDAHFRELFDKEFKELTSIGNNYRIRHHETYKFEINETEHYDYLFNRCLSLITTALCCVDKYT